MKRLFNALKRKTDTIVYLQTTKYPLILSTALLAMFLMSSCKKDVSIPISNEEIQVKSNSSSQKESSGFGNYTGLDPQTVWELQQAKIATAKYNNIENAIADGYFDAEIVVPEMGHHYLKLENLNATFEYDKPELLVYNKEENGRMKLVALEYAVPIASSPNAPSGFTGSSDSWGVYQGQLWTLHAWIWQYNPAGVFNPTNPLIHVH
jgi:hypothetical protein